MVHNILFKCFMDRIPLPLKQVICGLNWFTNLLTKRWVEKSPYLKFYFRKSFQLPHKWKNLNSFPLLLHLLLCKSWWHVCLFSFFYFFFLTTFVFHYYAHASLGISSLFLIFKNSVIYFEHCLKVKGKSWHMKNNALQVKCLSLKKQLKSATKPNQRQTVKATRPKQHNRQTSWPSL